MEGFEKFQHAILEGAKGYILPLMEEQKVEFGRAMKNHLLGLDGPTVVSSKHTGREAYFFKLFYGFTEIAGSLETFDDLSVLIGRFPFRGTRLTKDRYLRFHIESHIAEVYLLRERLRSYLTLLERQFKGDARLDGIKRVNGALRDTIKASLEGVIRARDSHVHEMRFKDKDLDRLRGIGLLVQGGTDDFAKAMQVFCQAEYALIRKKWKDKVAENNRAIRKLLNMFFDALYPIVFDSKTNALNYPSRLPF